MAAEVPDVGTAQRQIASTLDEVESRLLDLVREGGSATTSLDEVIHGLAQIVSTIGLQYRHLQGLFERRDLTFASTFGLEEVRHRTLWLYRKIQLEILFFTKLRLERSIRDALYKYVLETYEELFALENEERTMQKLHDDDLATRLLGNEVEALLP